MRVLVCGGRDFVDEGKGFRALDILLRHFDNVSICHGDAKGADRLAGQWALLRGVRCTVFPADWDRHGKAAGPIRNKQMLDEFKPEYVMAFPGGRGTANMIKQAQDAGITVYLLEEVTE